MLLLPYLATLGFNTTIAAKKGGEGDVDTILGKEAAVFTNPADYYQPLVSSDALVWGYSHNHVGLANA